MKRSLAKLLFPKLPRLVASKRVDQLFVVAFVSLLGICVVVVLLWTRNNQIGK